MATAQRYLLKMLSGPHRGAEVRLVAGQYRIGRDDDADIVLDDQALAAEHALLVIEPDGLRIEPLLGEVLINLQPHKDAGRRLPFFTVLALGATHLAVGPEEAAWPALALPAPAPVPAAAAEIVPAAAGDTALPAVRPKAGRAWGRIGGTVLLLGLLGLVLLARPLEHAEAPAAVVEPIPGAPVADPLAKAAAEVTAALTDTGVSGLKVSPDARRGRLAVEGWVGSEAERKAVGERLAGIDAPVTLRLWSRDQVMAGVTSTLQALGRPLQAEWAGPGEVALRGYLPNASDLQQVVDTLQRDVTGLRQVRNEVMTDEAVEAWLSQHLTEAGLAQAVRIRRGDRALQVRGTLTAEQRAKFDEVAGAYNAGPGRFLGLQAEIAEAQGPAGAPVAEAETLQFGVRAVSPGPPAYVVLEDGQKYLEGGRLPGGWTIERINGTAMLVSRGGRREQVAF